VICWGVWFEITWDEQAQAFFEKGRQVHFQGIIGFLIHQMTKRIEIIEP
jgi:hypothetical protein